MDIEDLGRDGEGSHENKDEEEILHRFRTTAPFTIKSTLEVLARDRGLLPALLDPSSTQVNPRLRLTDRSASRLRNYHTKQPKTDSR